MSALLHQYFNIAFLMGKPQDLPGGRQQLQIGVALSFVTYLLALGIIDGTGRAVLQAVIDLGCTAALFYGGLLIVGRTERFEQAYGGLCGASAILNMTAIPVFLGRSAPGEPPSAIAVFGEFLILVWSLSLFAHVVRHTFETGKLTSTVIAFSYFIVLATIMGGLAPSSGN